MSSERDRQIATAREIDKLSTVMLDIGVGVVKRNPLKVGGYVLGILLCLFFTGWSVSTEQRAVFQSHLAKIDHESIINAEQDLYRSHRLYENVRPWFWQSCNEVCQQRKQELASAQRHYDALRREEDNFTSNAKASLGLFSEYGVGETRELFWKRFSQGKNFATQQSKWDMLFMGIQSMGRDENLLSYALRVVLSMLFNFTLGITGAVVAFVFSLWHLISTYQSNPIVALVFFVLAALGAVSFAMTWLIGLYVGTAGTVYVGAKFIASNMRIEGGDPSGGYRRRVR